MQRGIVNADEIIQPVLYRIRSCAGPVKALLYVLAQVDIRINPHTYPDFIFGRFRICQALIYLVKDFPVIRLPMPAEHHKVVRAPASCQHTYALIQLHKLFADLFQNLVAVGPSKALVYLGHDFFKPFTAYTFYLAQLCFQCRKIYRLTLAAEQLIAILENELRQLLTVHLFYFLVSISVYYFFVCHYLLL